MSRSATVHGDPVTLAVASRAGAPAVGRETALDLRRKLQLALGAVWLFDAILQFQSFMFTRAFAGTLAASAAGNPPLLADPITWSATLVGHHAAAANTVFAVLQLLLGLGIAWRPTVRIALGASVVWALCVWWLGEGFGGILGGGASPVNGAPGPVILYGLLAVLLWPAARDRPAPFTAGRAVGARAARALWLILWASLAYFTLQPAVRAPGAIGGMISGMAQGQPGWLAWLGRHLAAVLAQQGLVASILLAVALAVVAAGPYLPPRWCRAAGVLAIAVAAFLWLASGLGGILTGMGTDPGNGPLLALLALAYWPAAATVRGTALVRGAARVHDPAGVRGATGVQELAGGAGRPPVAEGA